MNFDEFKRAFSEIRKRGFVPSQRRGPTGIGYTLETLLGIEENNIAVPDLGTVELKSRRFNSTSMVTLFTFNRDVWKMNPLDAVKQYGTPDENGRLGLYFTMARTPNSSGLFLHMDADTVSVRHIKGNIVAEWELTDLANQFMKKLPALMLVSAISEMRGKTEWFHYDRAQLLSGTSAEIMRNQISIGNILVDLRLHDKGTSARNHGTGFRTHEGKLQYLFGTIKDV